MVMHKEKKKKKKSNRRYQRSWNKAEKQSSRMSLGAGSGQKAPTGHFIRRNYQGLETYILLAVCMYIPEMVLSPS